MTAGPRIQKGQCLMTSIQACGSARAIYWKYGMAADEKKESTKSVVQCSTIRRKHAIEKFGSTQLDPFVVDRGLQPSHPSRLATPGACSCSGSPGPPSACSD